MCSVSYIGPSHYKYIPVIIGYKFVPRSLVYGYDRRLMPRPARQTASWYTVFVLAFQIRIKHRMLNLAIHVAIDYITFARLRWRMT